MTNYSHIYITHLNTEVERRRKTWENCPKTKTKTCNRTPYDMEDSIDLLGVKMIPWLCLRLFFRVELKYCPQVGKARIPGRAVTRVWELQLSVNYSYSVDDCWN